MVNGCQGEKSEVSSIKIGPTMVLTGGKHKKAQGRYTDIRKVQWVPQQKEPRWEDPIPESTQLGTSPVLAVPPSSCPCSLPGPPAGQQAHLTCHHRASVSSARVCKGDTRHLWMMERTRANERRSELKGW